LAVAETAAAAPANVISSRALRVLLAEDDPTNQMVTIAMLKELGHTVDLAWNGREALALATARDAGYDLILMDIMMPEMDGLAAIQAIRDLDGPASATRIIALTANALPEDEHRCRAAGADDFLTKPLRLATLEATLGRVAAPVLHAFDPHPARQMAAELGDVTYAEIRDLFLAELAQRLDRLERLDPGSERIALQREAHAMKSSAAAFGLTALVAAAAEIERGALHDAPAATAERVTRLKPIAAAVPAALAAVDCPAVTAP
jgi:CheY-like chemotaxis protein